MDKRRNENNDKIKQIKLIMIFGYALIVIIAAVFMAYFTIRKNDMVLKSKVTFMENSDMLDAFQEACNAVLYGKTDTEEKAAELYEQFNAILNG